MLKILIHLAADLFALLALCGLGYLGLSLWSEWRFLRRRALGRRDAARRRAAGEYTPAVSILKPLRGGDRQMYESFRSHCLQDYPEYEIIFGVNQASDEAVAEVERLQREFPAHDIRLVICSEGQNTAPLKPTDGLNGPPAQDADQDAKQGANRKVSNLVQMMRVAKYDHIVINDSDIRVQRDYLRRVVAPMENARVGLVTALYRAEAGRSAGNNAGHRAGHNIASRIEAITIATDFAGGVLCATELEGGLHFGLGSTLAFPRAASEAIGGLEKLMDYLADDHELGRMIWEAGYEVVLCDTVVETFLPEYGWSAMFEHQLRWARTVRDLRKWGYIGVLLTFGLPWALAAALCAGGAKWSLALLAAVAAARFASGYVLCGPILNDRQTMRDLWLIPARDVVGVAIWFASFGGDTIVWRGERFHLKDGRLTRA